MVRYESAGFAIVLAIMSPVIIGRQGVAPPGLRFEISFPASAHSGPITGRVFVMISRTGEREPRLQIGRTGVPFFGRDVERLAPGQAAVIDETDLGTPVERLRDLPAGDYFVQGFVNVYSEFKRADGHTVWMHDDQWEGQRWNISPGNLKSAVQKIHLDPKAGGVVKLPTADAIPPIAVAARHAVRQAVQVPEPDADEVLGTADLSRRDGALAEGLRPRNH